MIARLPAAAELDRVVAALLTRLDTGWSTILDDPRWTDVRASVHRLAEPGAVARLATDLGEARCQRLTDLLLTRWAAIDTVELPPAAAIVTDGPDHLGVLVDGVDDDDWRAVWAGPVQPADPRGARVRLDRGPGAGPAPAGVTVRVFARTRRGRVILAARWAESEARDGG